MIDIVNVMFWISAVAAVYSYALYPAILLALPKRRSASIGDLKSIDLPSVSLIVAAHNEESVIASKLKNCLALDYPQDKFEIVVASDASTDKTNQIVHEFSEEGVTLVDSIARNGKEYAQAQALGASSGDILVFSDAATMIEPPALRIVAQAFSDSAVGALSSTDRFETVDGRIAGEGLYVRYEMWLRRMESGVAGLVGLSGSFFAARREVCDNWDLHSPSDFSTACNCARLGLVAISSDDLYGIYKDVKNGNQEYQRKVRTVVRGITGLMRNLSMLNPSRFGLFSFQMWSHKVMRWLTPWFLASVFISNVVLAQNSILFSIILVTQIAFYGIALLAWGAPVIRRNVLARIIYFFVQSNLAVAHATVRYFSGDRITVWTPSER